MIQKILVSIIFVFLYINVSQCDFQLGKYNPPNLVNYTTCFLGTGAAKSYCPIGTYCTKAQLPSGLYLGASSALELLVAQPSSPGCCPYNTNPCHSTKFGFTVPACCPINQTCCYDNFEKNRFIGCVDDIRQCCGNIICPTGYSCCRRNVASEYYCCPGLTACSIISSIPGVNQTNQTVFTNITYWPNSYPSGSNSVLDMPLSNMCQMVINATFVSPWPLDQVVPCGSSGSLCLNATEDCYSNNGTNLSIETNNNSTITQSDGLLCCKKNTTACVNSRVRGSNTLIGCADPTLNETCCGQSICPSGSKCCHVAPPNDGTYAINTLYPYGFYNLSGYNGAIPIGNGTNNIPGYIFPTDKCCPIGTYCCARRINTDGTNNPKTRIIFVYCGRNEMCTSDAMISESYQPVPRLTGFLPEYIESMGWIVPGNVFAATPTSYNCNTCSAPSSPTACNDPCKLDVTASTVCS